MGEKNQELEEQKKQQKSKAGLFATLIIMLLLLILALWFFFFRGRTANEKVGGGGFWSEVVGSRVDLDDRSVSAKDGKGLSDGVAKGDADVSLKAEGKKGDKDTGKGKEDASGSGEPGGDRPNPEADNPDNTDRGNDNNDQGNDNNNNSDNSGGNQSSGASASTGHQHSFDRTVVTSDPTCGDMGLGEAYCSCGEYITVSLPPTGNHQWGDAEFLGDIFEDSGTPGSTDYMQLFGRKYRHTCGVCGATEEWVEWQ